MFFLLKFFKITSSYCKSALKLGHWCVFFHVICHYHPNVRNGDTMSQSTNVLYHTQSRNFNNSYTFFSLIFCIWPMLPLNSEYKLFFFWGSLFLIEIIFVITFKRNVNKLGIWGRILYHKLNLEVKIRRKSQVEILGRKI